jgi:hypothetical protein
LKLLTPKIISEKKFSIEIKLSSPFASNEDEKEVEEDEIEVEEEGKEVEEVGKEVVEDGKEVDMTGK